MKRVIKSSEEIFGMARVGYSGDLEVYVNTNDGGNIPHFHLRDQTDWERFHSCIKIASPEYFLHEGKEDTLNSKQRKELYDFMNSKVSLTKYADKFDNNWQLICFLWELNNSSTSIPEDTQMPDYRQLRG